MKIILKLFFVIYSGILCAEPKLKIALTFDDAPRPDSLYFTGIERTNKLLEVLREKEIEQATFFCNTKDFSVQDIERIQNYSNAGHLIANHSAHHFDYQTVGFEVFTNDIHESHSLLSGFPTYKKIFRFPYLRQGISESSREQINSFLEVEKYKHGYVTVETYDWELDRLFQNDLLAKRAIDMVRLREVYLKIIWEGILFYDQLSLEVLGYSPKHIILLHENDINTLFVGDLIDLIRAKDGEIITLEEAFEDPISTKEFDLLPYSQRRIRSIAKHLNYTGSTVSRWEKEEEIEKIYETIVH